MLIILKNIYIKKFCKNIHYIILFILIILILLLFINKYNYNYKEMFIGKNEEKEKEINEYGNEINVEKKSYTQFPPLENKSKYDLLNNIFGKNNNENENNHNKNENEKSIKDIPISMPQINDKGIQELEKSDLQKTFSKIDEKKPLLGSCHFYFNKCPNNKSSMATIKGNNLTCGGEETKKAEAIAEIKNGHISKIRIIHNGTGYNYQNPPKVIIESTSGNGASAKANVNKNGEISSIDIIDYGYGYVETPNINIEPPQMDGVCHLCC